MHKHIYSVYKFTVWALKCWITGKRTDCTNIDPEVLISRIPVKSRQMWWPSVLPTISQKEIGDLWTKMIRQIIQNCWTSSSARTSNSINESGEQSMRKTTINFRLEECDYICFKDLQIQTISLAHIVKVY